MLVSLKLINKPQQDGSTKMKKILQINKLKRKMTLTSQNTSLILFSIETKPLFSISWSQLTIKNTNIHQNKCTNYTNSIP